MITTWLRQWTNPDSATFALRFALAVLLTWSLSWLMDSEVTGTAMMTAAIIQITGSRGASVKKSVARLTGTLIGGVYILLVASVTLIDAWLFNSFIILGIVVSLGIASYFHRRIAYMFAVVGITLSLAGFPVSTEPSLSSLFDHVQLRCLGISFGILMAMAASYIIPYADDQRELKFIKTITQRFIDELFQTEASNTSKAIRSFLNLVGKKWLAVDDEIYGSKSSKRAKELRRSTFYNCINLGVEAIELRRMGDSFSMTAESWHQIKENRFKVDGSEEHLSELHAAEKTLFVNKALEFSQKLLRSKQLPSTTNSTADRYVDDIGNFTDGWLVLSNMLRASIALFLLSFMWIELQWQDGLSAAIMGGMIISAYAANPGSERVFSPTFYAQFIAGAFAFFMTFVVMPIGSPLLVFATGFVGIYVMAYWFWQSQSLLKITLMISLFCWSNSVPLTGTPTFDFAHFLNTFIANFVGLFALWFAYQLVPSRTTTDVIRKQLKLLTAKLKNGTSSEKISGNINNLILSAYSFLVDESDNESIFTLLYTKAVVRVLEKEELSEKEREVLQSSIGLEQSKLKDATDLNALLNAKTNDVDSLNYNWFSLNRVVSVDL